MLLELGPLRLATGAHRSGVVAKGLGPGGAVNPDATTAIQAIAAQSSAAAASAPAMGTRPNPGPLPPITEAFADPLRSQIVVGVNQRWTPRADYNQNPFKLLTDFAATCWPVRVCIEARKDQIESLDWDIVARDGVDADDSTLGRLRTFFQSPDGRISFSDWLRLALEEILVKDALTLYRRKNRGGGFFGLEIVGGETIKVLIDNNGRIPLAPQKAFRQIQWGAPVALGDYSTDEMYYLPRTVRTETPYGFSPVEWVLLTIITVINRQTFQLGYYADGNVPAGLVEIASAITPEQIRTMQAYIDTILGGNTAARQRLKVVPPKSAVHEFTKPDWSTGFDEFLVKIVGAAFAVPPSEIGFTNDVNRATGKQQENVVYRRGVKPMARYLKGIFDRVIANDLQAPGYEFAFSGGEPEDMLTQAKTDQVYVAIGKTSVDELRQRDGQDPIGLPNYVATASGPVLVSELVGPLAALPPDTDVDVLGDGDNAQLGAPDDTGDRAAAAEAIGAELKVWRARAIKDIKVGKAIRPFKAHAIPAGAAAVLAVRLTKAASVGDVVTAFSRPLVRKAERRSVAALRASRTAALEPAIAHHFTTMGKALVTHVQQEAR